MQGDITVARWYSGDELIIVAPEGSNGQAIAARLRTALNRGGISATFGTTTLRKHEKFADAVKRCSQAVQTAKYNQNRGSITRTA